MSIEKPIIGIVSKHYPKYEKRRIDTYIRDEIKNAIFDNGGIAIGIVPTEKGINLAQETIQAFKKNWIGKRVLTIISMIALTGVIMSIIPKLYTLASGKKNPDTKVFTDVAKEREVK